MKSGFNLLSLKKEENSTGAEHYYRHVIIGDDLYSLSVVDKLIESGETSIAWLSTRELSKQDLRLLGPSDLRGESNISWFQKRYPEVPLSVDESTPEFYKELKWRPVGGRAKSEPMLWNESFFAEKRAFFNEEDVFPFIASDEKLALLNEKRLELSLLTVSKMTPDDLASPAHFCLETTTEDTVRCEKLYWGLTPARFVDYYKELEDLSSEFIEACEQTKTPSALYVSLNFEKVISEKEETLFIPLSYTHEWGHFVGEFYKENDKQRAEFVTFLDKNATSEEDISKKIRLLKRNLEKIFPLFKDSQYSEFIKLSDDSFCLNVDDKLIDYSNKVCRNLSFIGRNAPVREVLESGGLFADSPFPCAPTARALKANAFILV